MTECTHANLTPSCEAYVISREHEGGDIVVARAVHVKVECAVCGQPFRFIGGFRSPQEVRDGVFGEGEPWGSTSGDELAAWVEPLPPDGKLADMTVAGSA